MGELRESSLFMWEQRKIFHCSFSFGMKAASLAPSASSLWFSTRALQLFPHCRPPADMLPWQPLMVQAASNSLSNLLCPSLGTTSLAPGYSVVLLLTPIQCTKPDRLGFLSKEPRPSLSAYIAKTHQCPLCQQEALC